MKAIKQIIRDCLEYSAMLTQIEAIIPSHARENAESMKRLTRKLPKRHRKDFISTVQFHIWAGHPYDEAVLIAWRKYTKKDFLLN